MRAAFGLPPADIRTGQSAHDVWMLAHAPRVLLTRARKIGGKPADDQRDRGAQVRRHHRRALQPLRALHQRDVAVEPDVRSQPRQFLHMHEAVLEDGLADPGAALGDAVDGHELRLHVGREGGVLAGAEAHGARAALGLHADPVVAAAQRGAGLAQLVEHRVEMARLGAPQRDITARRDHRAQEGAGFDAVGDDVVRPRGRLQTLDAVDDDAVGAVPLDAGAHGDQQLGQVGDLGFLGGILQHRLPVGQGGGHQQVFRASHGDHVGNDTRAAQTFCFRVYIASFDRDLSAHRLQAFDMLIDRT